MVSPNYCIAPVMSIGAFKLPVVPVPVVKRLQKMGTNSNTCLKIWPSIARTWKNKLMKVLFIRTGIRAGKTKVFLRSCVHEPLEERRRQVQRRSATLIQKMWRGLRQWRRYRQIRQAAKRIQVSRWKDLYLLKRQCQEIFDPLFFVSSNNLP
jgi:myosin heavy subunit